MTLSIPEHAWQAGHTSPVDEAKIAAPLISFIEAVVRRMPDAPALVDSGRQLTYREMWNATMARAAEIASFTQPGDRVGIRLPAGVEYGVTILACLAAGRISVLFDLADPQARMEQIIRIAGITHAIGTAPDSLNAVIWHRLADLDTQGPLRPAPPPMDIDVPAFMVATSGSTGVPKLIVHSQRRQAILVHGTGKAVHMTQGDRSVFTGSPSTGAAVQYLFMPLVLGATAVLCDLRAEGLNRFLALLQQQRATVLRIFPSLARMLAALPNIRPALAHMKSVRTIGEPLKATDLVMLRRILPPDAMILNSYGATETLGFDWIAPPGDYHGGAVLPSGQLRFGADFVLIGDDGAPCPPGEAGELLIRSRYNAVGEWRDGQCVPGPMQTDPLDPSKTIYRTGDLAVIGADGNLTVLGRADRQVKINGNRVELAEIEEAMRACPWVAAAAVVARRDETRTVLLGFFVPSEEAPGDMAQALRAILAERLPPAMLPSRLLPLDALPTLPGFKLDTASLLSHAARAAEGSR